MQTIVAVLNPAGAIDGIMFIILSMCTIKNPFPGFGETGCFHQAWTGMLVKRMVTGSELVFFQRTQIDFPLNNES